MNSIWITYAWDDNKDGDVDFAAQELMRAGLDIKLDRWSLSAGKRLWEQIEHFIQDDSLSDGWLLYATQSSLGNENHCPPQIPTSCGSQRVCYGRVGC